MTSTCDVGGDNQQGDGSDWKLQCSFGVAKTDETKSVVAHRAKAVTSSVYGDSEALGHDDRRDVAMNQRRQCWLRSFQCDDSLAMVVIALIGSNLRNQWSITVRLRWWNRGPLYDCDDDLEMVWQRNQWSITVRLRRWNRCETWCGATVRVWYWVLQQRTMRW
ncbi:hypothetical protein F0562_013704 [Nyssa sinensis]|uniref:Uncharacterized protein n=1 Tax=Nyssa sinensis TaxID=561372 RepID=A0A5J4ZQR3_9ASTE|nr:hypothetical protein F0562_013704 [Nyssa sinensis]